MKNKKWNYNAYCNIKMEDGKILLLQDYIIVWLDILGQSKTFSQLDLPLPLMLNEKYDIFKRVVKETFFKVKQFRTIIEDLIREFNAKNLYKSDSLVEISRIDIQFISDSAILKIPFIKNFEETERIPLASLIIIFLESLKDICNIVSGIMMFSFSQGIAIRGAIDFGVCAEMNEIKTDIYGAGVVNAYRNEAKVAKYPRIVIGEHLCKTIGFYCNIYNKQPELFVNRDATLRNQIEHFRRYFSEDQDGIPMLSYLDFFTEDHEMFVEQKEIIIEAYKFIEEQLQIHIKNADDKLSGRYKLVKAYFLERLDVSYNSQKEIVDIALK